MPEWMETIPNSIIMGLYWIKIKYRFALFYRTLLLKFGLQKILLRNRYGEHILVFHGIDAIGETRFNSRFVSAAYFEAFIVYITTHYHIVSLDDYYQRNFKSDTLNIALTFDDGYLNNYKYAIPILKKYKVPACFYITTIHENESFLWPDFLDLVSFYTKKRSIIFEEKEYVKSNKNEFVYNGISLKNRCKKLSYQEILPIHRIFKEEWEEIQTIPIDEYWKLMTIDQIQEISDDPLFTIGSHSFTHSNLANIPIDEAKEEILKSKKILENILGHPINEFAFPFGTYTKELVNYCKYLNFEKILLVDYNTEIDKEEEVLRNRFVINPYISMKHQLVCLLKDSYF